MIRPAASAVPFRAVLAAMLLVAAAVAVGPGAGSAAAQTDPANAAERAIAMLDAAADALAGAEDAPDRVAALTETVRAYEEGLVAVREGLRRAALREATLTAGFEAERERLAELLGAIQSIERAPPPLTLLHPAGPVGTARAGMILGDVTPAVAREAAALRAG
ncbi:peptidase M23, partial [Rhodobacterales bacterium HKCCE2091]|nr:peptidase M23 [Rhodobacterales bacterium HKCCE2091]